MKSRALSPRVGVPSSRSTPSSPPMESSIAVKSSRSLYASNTTQVFEEPHANVLLFRDDPVCDWKCCICTMLNCGDLDSCVECKTRKGVSVDDVVPPYQQLTVDAARENTIASIPVPFDTDLREPALFATLPDELLVMIIQFLSLADQLACRCVCRTLQAAVHRLHGNFSSLDLHSIWPEVTGSVLRSVAPLVVTMQTLSLSWISELSGCSAVHIRNIFEQPCTLTVLRLASCTLDSKVICAVTRNCPLLTELDLHGCQGYFWRTLTLNDSCLHSLRRLNVSNTSISELALVQLISTNPCLEHISLGHCMAVEYWGEITNALAHCPKLLSIDFWRARTLNSQQLLTIINKCSALTELDVGWCRDLVPDSVVPVLVQQCKLLTKLCMTSLRSASDISLTALACAPLLRSLDLLGCNVSAAVATTLLTNCKYMQFLDISFCRGISTADVLNLRVRFPDVAIKKSFCT